MNQDYSKLLQMGLTAAAILGFAAWQLWSTKRQPRAKRARVRGDVEE